MYNNVAVNESTVFYHSDYCCSSETVGFYIFFVNDHFSKSGTMACLGKKLTLHALVAR